MFEEFVPGLRVEHVNGPLAVEAFRDRFTVPPASAGSGLQVQLPVSSLSSFYSLKFCLVHFLIWFLIQNSSPILISWLWPALLLLIQIHRKTSNGDGIIVILFFYFTTYCEFFVPNAVQVHVPLLTVMFFRIEKRYEHGPLIFLYTFDNLILSQKIK